MTSILHRPQFSAQDASTFAKEHYGVSAQTQELPSERDRNFLLTASSGQKYVLKIANGQESEDALDLQNQAMALLLDKSKAPICPRVLADLSGKQISQVKDENDRLFYVRLLTYLPGIPLAKVKALSADLLSSLGSFLGSIDKILLDFSHPAMTRELHWNIKHATTVISEYLHDIENKERRKRVEDYLAHFKRNTVPLFSELRTSVIHNDANDHNILVNGYPWKKISGIVDFGDMVESYTVAELAISCAYVMLHVKNPITAASHLVRGYHQVLPLTEPESEVLFDLICIRLCTSVALSAHQKQLEPDNSYLSITEKPAWELLENLSAVNSRFAHYTFREACGLTPCPKSVMVVKWLKENQNEFAAVCGADLKTVANLVFDLSVGSLEIANLTALNDTQAWTRSMFETMENAGVDIGVGRYNEARLVYTSEQFQTEDESPERRTVHLGIDLFMKAGTPIYAPLDGTIHSFADNALALDYGPTIILQHEPRGTKEKFFTLYGHLSEDSLAGLSEGQRVKKGERIATLGTPEVNGGWPPHLHFQVIADLLDKKGDYPGVAAPSERNVWLSICPDPNLILQIPADSFPDSEPLKDETLVARQKHISSSLSLSYKKPLKIVRGWMQYLYADEGRQYLDAVNNVPHVGHNHPEVVRAAQQQMAVLNTNTRYLHDNITRYAQRLCDLLPDPLNVCFFVNSGSEANDLALRLARTHTQATNFIVVDGAYHGNLSSLIEISPYKFDGPGGAGAPSHVKKVEMPDVYRGSHKSSDADAGKKYARDVKEAIAEIEKRDGKPAAFIHESLLSCGGQIVLPEKYLKEAYRYVRDAGGVCIADEVQVGFGRIGTYFWGFETHGVVPDIVTLGKPIGNGHPIGAVVTTPEIAASFDTGMEYFNTYGGNPVSCAVGLAVLDIIKNEKLQKNALQVGAFLIDGLKNLKTNYPLIGDVRGLGLFLGVEFVKDPDSLEPAAEEASYIVEQMKDRGILLSTDGPFHNIIKIKPPLCFSRENADFLVKTLDDILQEL